LPKQLLSPTPINGFKGLNERRLFDTSPVETTSLNNVKVRDGVVEGRKGCNELADDATSAIGTTPIIGMWPFDRSTSNSQTLIRMTRTKVEKFNGTTWDNITGTDLASLAVTRPQACTHGESDLFCFTNEGIDRPRKYTGTGTTAVLGGTPPYAKSIVSYVGFLGLGNTSDDGVTFEPLNLVLSDDPDGTWTDCSTQDRFFATLILNETPGPILAMEIIGRSLYVYKSDGIVRVTFTGGVTRFQRELMPLPIGIIAPLSLQRIGELGHIFLAQDRNLYINNGSTVVQLPVNVQRTLRETMSVADAPYVRSAVNEDTDTYELFYQKDGSTYLDARITYNYRSGEFYRSEYPIEFNSASSYRSGPTVASQLVASTATLTYELDTGTNDNGTSIDRYYDIDWSSLGLTGTKYLCGAEFTFKKARDTRVKISVAVDRSSKFVYPKSFHLQGTDPDEEVVRVSYNIPSPLFGTYFKVRIQMYHEGATHVVQLQEFAPELVRVNTAQTDTPNLSSPSRVN
jgi:hypothetical protein